MSVLIETTLGDMVVDLFVNERPTSSKNFLKLCKMKYYNLNQIFLIESNYIAQTGDPTNTSRGGESMFGILYGEQARYFEMELVPKLRHTRRGLISMVNNGDNMLGSQFFITLNENLDYLDGKHCIIGQVAEGLDTVSKINEQMVDDNNAPYRDIRITHTIILHDPFDDPPRLPIPKRSPSPTEDLIKISTKIALDEKVDETEGKTAEEVKREMEEKEARTQAQILEMVGDLRHADERPPDNVLFVCKLNPATSSEDLEIIFSRFGTITCCEVICDRRTGDSLQYAFIEFEKPEECEAAYLKMDNTLIDDRRIHVDFSQSVAKNYQWKKHGAASNGGDKDDEERKNVDERRGKSSEKKIFSLSSGRRHEARDNRRGDVEESNRRAKQATSANDDPTKRSRKIQKNENDDEYDRRRHRASRADDGKSREEMKEKKRRSRSAERQTKSDRHHHDRAHRSQRDENEDKHKDHRHRRRRSKSNSKSPRHKKHRR